jgi:hypothetical protein
MRIGALSFVVMEVAVVAGLVGTAFAAPEDRDKGKDKDTVQGFVTYGTGEVSGRVTDEDGHPLADAEVHIVAGAAVERVVKTDNDGKFKATVGGGGSSWVFVHGRARITGQTLVPTEGDGEGEIVEIHEVIPPAVMPKPLSDPLTIPAYSDEAIKHNTWTRAWLMLDIDDTGKVRRLKVIKRPGFDLDAIAIRAGFALRFAPALDRAKRPTAALGIWKFEWPAYYWLLEQKDKTISHMPNEAINVPCRGTGPTNSTYRDCSRAELSKAMSQPWIDRPAKK